MNANTLIGLAILSGAGLYWYKSRQREFTPRGTALPGRETPPTPRRHAGTVQVPASGTVPGAPSAPSGPSGASGDKVPAGEPVPPEWMPAELLSLWSELVAETQEIMKGATPEQKRSGYEISMQMAASVDPAKIHNDYAAAHFWKSTLQTDVVAQLLGRPRPAPPPFGFPGKEFLVAGGQPPPPVSSGSAPSVEEAKALALSWAAANRPEAQFQLFLSGGVNIDQARNYRNLIIDGQEMEIDPADNPMRQVTLISDTAGIKNVLVTAAREVIPYSTMRGGFQVAKKNPAGALSVGALVLAGLAVAYYATGEKK